MPWVLALGWVGLAGVAALALALITTSIRERRYRAMRVSVLLALPLLGLPATLLLLDFPGRTWIVLGLLIVAGLAVVALALPLGRTPHMRIISDQSRLDERDIIFHRFYRLQPGTPEFQEHYRLHPEQRAFDEKVRALPPLAHPGTKAYDPLASPFAAATFDVLERMTADIEWEPAPIEPRRIEATPEEFTRRIKGFARHLGADLVGTTALNPAYVYSHIGRSPGALGAPIDLGHDYAAVFAVEMDHEMVRQAPDTATMTETAFKYFEVAKIAMLVARYINLLGYEARAHVDGNYRVLCGPIAADAGLGELGRLGLLITPRFGPRVRLSVVTTNLPLLQDRPVRIGVQDFCNFCKKCAVNCPSQAIEEGDKGVHRGVEKWQSSQEKCYRFWRLQGTDCAVCITVCPYSHPSTPLHNLVRWAVRRNALARRVALWGDDFFYGRRPVDRCPLPIWHAKSRPAP
jgi:ferredoxin